MHPTANTWDEASSGRAWRFGPEGLTPTGSGAMVSFGGGAGTVVDFDGDMNEVLILGLERVLQTTLGVYIGEAPRTAASFNRGWSGYMLTYEDDLTYPIDARLPLRCRWLHKGWKARRVRSGVTTEDCD